MSASAVRVVGPATQPAPLPRIAHGTVALLALAAAYAYVHTTVVVLINFGLRYPFSDQYRIYAHFFEQPLVDAIIGLENGHRPVVAALIRLAEMRWAAADQWVQLAVGSAMALATALTLAVAAWREAALRASARAAAALFAVVGVLWLGNVRMLFHGGEAVHVYPVTFATVLAALCVFATAKGRSTGWVVVAALLCSVATFSFGSGVASFAALFAVAILLRLDWRHWPAPLAIIVADVVLYLYVLPGSEGAKNSLALQLDRTVVITLRLLSSPWIFAEAGRLLGAAGRGAPSLALGAIGLIAYAGGMVDGYRRGRRLPRMQAVAIAIATLGLATAALIGLSRVDYMAAVPDQVFADRYLVWSSLFWAGIGIHLVGAFATAPNGDRYAFGAGIVALILAAFLWKTQAMNAGWAAAVHRINQRTAVAARLGIWDAELFPAGADATPEQVRLTQERFREHRWSMFRTASNAETTVGTRLADIPRAPSRSAITSGETIDDPLRGTALRFAGRYAQGTRLPARPAIVVFDPRGNIAGEAMPSFVPDSRALLWTIPAKLGFDGYIVAPQPGSPYVLVLYDADTARPVNALEFAVP